MKRIIVALICVCISSLYVNAKKDSIQGEYILTQESLIEAAQQTANDNPLLILLMTNFGKDTISIEEWRPTAIVSSDKIIIDINGNKDEFPYKLGKQSNGCKELIVTDKNNETLTLCYSNGQISWHGLVFKKKK